MEALKRIIRNSGCDQAGQSQQSLIPFHEAIYNEAKVILVTVEDKEQLNWFRRMAAIPAVKGESDQLMTQTEYNRRLDEYLNNHLQ